MSLTYPDYDEFVNEIMNEIICNYFNGFCPKISKLTGGHSNTCLLIDASHEDMYVLRIIQQDTDKELYAMQQAMLVNVSPMILYVTKNKRGILMQYIKGNHLCGDINDDTIDLLAHSLYLFHSTNKNPYIEISMADITIDIYHQIKDNPHIRNDLDKAIDLMQEYIKQIDGLNLQKVNLHGDLNTRNIIFSMNRIVFLDYEYVTWDVPHYDLSYLSLRLCLDDDQELKLLNKYFNKPISDNDIWIYNLTKKIHLTQICVFFHYFSIKYNSNNDVVYNKKIKNHMHYMKIWNIYNDFPNIAQLYYDTARASLYSAMNI